MGSNDEDVAYAVPLNLRPVHRVRITKGFWLGKYEVTNAQYRKFCEATGRKFPRGDRRIEQGDHHPVVEVRWHDAKAYCDHYGLSLPTEAQWEHAARGPEGRKYPWGDEWDPKKCCNPYNKGPGGRTFPVGSFPEGASWCGALDMAGNVWEWCGDWHGLSQVGFVDDPTGPATGLLRVLRGGSWRDDSTRYFRGTYRCRNNPSVPTEIYGFRCSRGL